MAARGTTQPIIEQLPSSSPVDRHAHDLTDAPLSTKSSPQYNREKLTIVDKSVEVREIRTR